jgi:hypothetical protein
LPAVEQRRRRPIRKEQDPGRGDAQDGAGILLGKQRGAPNHLLGPPALGQIDVGLEDLRDPAGRIPPGQPPALHNDVAAVPGRMDQLARPATRPFELAVDLVQRLQKPRLQQRVRRRAHCLRLRPPVERFGALAPQRDRAVRLPDDDGVQTEVDERDLPAQIILQPQDLENMRGLRRQPVRQTELLCGPFLLLVAVDDDRAEGVVFPSPHWCANDGEEGRLAGQSEDLEIGASGGVVEGDRSILLDDELGKVVWRQQRIRHGSDLSPTCQGARHERVSLLLEDDHQRGRLAEHLHRRDADLVHRALLASSQPGRIEKRLEQLAAALRFHVQRLDLFGLRLEFLVLAREFFSLRRRFFLLLRQFPGLPRQMCGLPRQRLVLLEQVLVEPLQNLAGLVL